jgi:hypothetical protein
MYLFYHKTYYSKDKGDLCWATQPSIYDKSIEMQLRVNIFSIFHFQMGGYLECIRFCIYDSMAS